MAWAGAGAGAGPGTGAVAGAGEGVGPGPEAAELAAGEGAEALAVAGAKQLGCSISVGLQSIDKWLGKGSHAAGTHPAIRVMPCKHAYGLWAFMRNASMHIIIQTPNNLWVPTPKVLHLDA